MEVEKNWEQAYRNELIEVITSYSPEQVCQVNPDLVKGKYPFEYNIEPLKVMPLVQVMFIKNLLENKWKK